MRRLRIRMTVVAFVFAAFAAVYAADSTAALDVDSIRALAKSYYMEGKFDKAIVLYKEIMADGKANRSDSVFLTSAYLNVRKPELAKEVAFAVPSWSAYADAWMEWPDYKKPELNDSLKIILIKCMSTLLDSIGQTPGSEVRCVLWDYLDMEERVNRKRERGEMTRGFVVTMSLLVLLTGVVLMSIYAVQRYKRKIEDNMALAIQMQEDLLRLTRNHDEYSGKVKGLLSTKYKLLDQLSQIVYESTTSAAARRRTSDAIAEMIGELGEEDSLKNQELAAFVDDAFGNLYSQFKTDYPDLRQGEYNLFVYSVLGFSASTITIFLKEKSVTSVYERKRRLRNKIKASPSARQEEYLAYLGQRAAN